MALAPSCVTVSLRASAGTCPIWAAGCVCAVPASFSMAACSLCALFASAFACAWVEGAKIKASCALSTETDTPVPPAAPTASTGRGRYSAAPAPTHSPRQIPSAASPFFCFFTRRTASSAASRTAISTVPTSARRNALFSPGCRSCRSSGFWRAHSMERADTISSQLMPVPPCRGRRKRFSAGQRRGFGPIAPAPP